MVGYYVDWNADKYKPSDIPLTKLTHINYAFAIPKSDGSFSIQTGSTLTQVVSLAHAKNVKVVVSVGGASDSKPFSSIVGSSSSIDKFATTCATFASKYKIDGIDIDWETPANEKEALGLVSLLKAIRAKNGASFIISMAVPSYTLFSKVDSTNKALADASDYVNIMSYDVYLPDSADGGKTGVNSPFEDKSDEQNSFCGSFATWKAFFPADKIVMGFPFYGYGWPVAPDSTCTTPTGLKMAGKRDCSDGQSDDSQTWEYKNIVTQIGTGKNGWEANWDTKSQTPYAFNKAKGIMVSYDNPKSLQIKAKYAQSQKGGGGMIWSIDMDSNGALLDAIDCLRSGAAC